MRTGLAFLAICFAFVANTAHAASERQLERWLKRFPKADTNNDGRLSPEEAAAFKRKLAERGGRRRGQAQSGKSKPFSVDPGWSKDRFPDHAVCYRSAEEIRKIYADSPGRKGAAVTSYPKPTDGGMRIVGTGHSFMAPGYRTLPLICKAAGFEQPLLTHMGGGVTGSARYKWEQENGIFKFDRKPTPKLLASISNAKWDAMLWGPYSEDRPAYYDCWIDFCLKYNPGMKFFLSDAWPALHLFEQPPASEREMTHEAFAALGKFRNAKVRELLSKLKAKHTDRVFIMPTCDAMVLAVKYFHEGKLPGIDGIHKMVGKKKKSLWKDARGHLGPGFEYLEGYVFYATVYAKSPELIKQSLGSSKPGGFPSVALDRAFRKIAWEAVVGNPLSGVTDKNQNGIGDRHEPGAMESGRPEPSASTATKRLEDLKLKAAPTVEPVVEITPEPKKTPEAVRPETAEKPAPVTPREKPASKVARKKAPPASDSMPLVIGGIVTAVAALGVAIALRKKQGRSSKRRGRR